MLDLGESEKPEMSWGNGNVDIAEDDKNELNWKFTQPNKAMKLLKEIEMRKIKFVGHFIRRNSFITNMVEGLSSYCHYTELRDFDGVIKYAWLCSVCVRACMCVTVLVSLWIFLRTFSDFSVLADCLKQLRVHTSMLSLFPHASQRLCSQSNAVSDVLKQMTEDR